MNELVIKDIESASNVLTELETAFFDIPFENSDFQNKTFVLAEQITPARAYRALGLRMFAKLRAIQEYKFGLEEKQIELDEIDFKLSQPNLDQFEKRRLELKKIRMCSQDNWTEKLLNDAIKELNCLYGEFVKYPKYSREQFELEEKEHYLLLLDKQASIGNDSTRSLLTIQKDLPELEAKISAALLEAK